MRKLALFVAILTASGLSAGVAFAQAAGEPNDHSVVVGHLGVGYFGEFDMGQVAVQQVGVRYWLRDNMGIDGAVGLGVTGSSNAAGEFGISASGGLPISLFAGKHYTFIFEPLARLGYGTVNDRGGAANYWHLQVGATAGCEIQFGFIGIPQLALDAQVGLVFDIQGDNAGNTSEYFGTTIGAQPWDIFRSTVAAIYYF
jgi:hypothetical protein